MKKRKFLLVSIVAPLLVSSASALAGDDVCKEGIWEVPYRKTVCYSQTMEQYMCVRDGKEMKFRFVQKLSVNSSLKDQCYIVDSFVQRPADGLIVK